MSPGPARGRGTGVDGGGGWRPARQWQLVRAGRDAVPASTRRFMARARRRRMRAALPWAVVGGMLAVAALVAWVLLGTGLFGVREVRVEGAELVSAVQVRNAAGVLDGAPLARVDLAELADRIGTLPPVERVTVHRDWPDALVVRLTERTPVAVVPRGEQFVVVDAAGVAFRTVSERPAGLPMIRLAEPGPDDPATDAGLEVLGALTPELREQLVEITVEGLARISVRLRGDLTVFWGDATRGTDKARVATALLDQDATRIDVSAPDVVTFR
ncbi:MULTISPECIES: cell division protein FtsQ/DivIB [Micromonospora]|uniref:Cell division protein FtsQ n=1 Tax=Micromonospora maris TaxID=1003110 RepID=A0A9X0I2M6_9ACTN|nr:MULTISPECIES: FtsQ-type POTRA domain-containing protein [Micromonospora]AEB46431.1 polypeptide-transport-associated domain-containing protein [Micromonospora maris AB-18-032]KUJ45660.1 peptidase S33 [Micromonospora maris]RUL94280.1 FtsQ-type POTRA domain-containing protein [Verrucosispora sp. FIM060022]